MKYELNTYHRNIPEQDLLDDLRRVASKLGKSKVTMEEYSEHGKYAFGTLQKRFNGWTKALKKSGLDVNIERDISNEKLFENIEVVWITLGRQPLYSEIKQPLSKYSTKPYDKRFGSWRKALEAFIEYVDSDNENNQSDANSTEISVELLSNEEPIFKHKTKRFPSERLKVQVLMRDGNKCKLCGITVTGDNIHFDHIKPWSKGGETVLKNLQVLCDVHNLAKGNLDYTTGGLR